MEVTNERLEYSSVGVINKRPECSHDVEVEVIWILTFNDLMSKSSL